MGTQTGEMQVVYAQGRPVGRIQGEWLEKGGLDPNRHMMRSPRGWATDAGHLELPVKGIRLRTIDGEVWEATIELWRRYGVCLDRGWGTQVLLPVSFWTVRRRGVRQLGLAL